MARTTTDTPTLRQVIGANIRDLRRTRGMTQEELGEQIAAHLGDSTWLWSKSMVSKLESGKRDFRVEELLVVGLVLRYNLSQFLRLAWKGDPILPTSVLTLGDDGDKSPRPTVPATDVSDFFHGEVHRRTAAAAWELSRMENIAVEEVSEEAAAKFTAGLVASGGERDLQGAMEQGVTEDSREEQKR